MPKYVCDFDAVKDAAKAISDSGNTMESTVKKYDGNVNINLTGWDSNAKNAFSMVNYENVVMATYASRYADALGEFVNYAASEIEHLENELTKLKI